MWRSSKMWRHCQPARLPACPPYEKSLINSRLYAQETHDTTSQLTTILECVLHFVERYYSTAQKWCTRKNFFLRRQEEVLLAADCGSLELEFWKPQEFLCACMIKAQELLSGRMFEPQELLCGSLRFFAVTLWKERDRVRVSENAKWSERRNLVSAKNIIV